MIEISNADAQTIVRILKSLSDTPSNGGIKSLNEKRIALRISKRLKSKLWTKR